ncbi:BTAD domain-containing putative transcriptional regulator [Micromonospora sp. WMMD964]|uniref:AfsR/SARP family transcriptional regulator n=1 Tax=Micromonospora sp. WMMD964 TaxID=3016091 RepID=UPI00249CDE8E|nr:BTAD domain-containing putative transcriptional regulator [Micromonospora sp. WMMD964]WFF03751.1 BTAD domain-containing putative transcriptional regulator [Micromonospora sp. WMMD964]
MAGRQIDLGPPKQRRVLAALAVNANQCVPVEMLVDRVWEDGPPGDARGVLYSYLTRLRRLLAVAGAAASVPITVGRRSGGYLLELPAQHVDFHRFLDQVGRARAMETADPERARLLGMAIELWRGEPLAGMPGDWAARFRQGLHRQLVSVLVEWADGELRQGRTAQVADRLSRALEREPLSEPIVLHLMHALRLTGRRAEALDQFARTRMLLSEELGVEPSAELRDLHRELLHDEECTPVPGRTATPFRPGCQLPADLPDHTGRKAETAAALAALSGPPKPDGCRPPLVISGPGGVGKTVLAIRLGHLLADSYPDGQILVGTPGAGLDAVLNQALRALGVGDVDRLRTTAEKLGQYRSALSGRRVLVVLDSAIGAEEVRSLIPGSPGSALIASSRARLTTIPGAVHLELGVLSPEQSMTLLRRLVGSDRLAAEPRAAADLVRVCAGLPLALRIVGARLNARPHRPLAWFAERLRHEQRRLDELTVGGLAVRLNVETGYRTLGPAAQRLFRLLGLQGLPRIGCRPAAVLLRRPLDEAEELLEQLADARLVEAVTGPGYQGVSYRMNDLVRLYAYECATQEEGVGALPQALPRVVIPDQLAGGLR